MAFGAVFSLMLLASGAAAEASGIPDKPTVVRPVADAELVAGLAAAGGLGAQAGLLCKRTREGYWQPPFPSERIYVLDGDSMWIVVCVSETRWSEGALLTTGRDGNIEKVARIPLHGRIVDAVELRQCAGVGIVAEIRDSTHMGTRTRSVYLVDAEANELRLLRNWSRFGHGYPPDDYEPCWSVAGKRPPRRPPAEG